MTRTELLNYESKLTATQAQLDAIRAIFAAEARESGDDSIGNIAAAVARGVDAAADAAALTRLVRRSM